MLNPTSFHGVLKHLMSGTMAAHLIAAGLEGHAPVGEPERPITHDSHAGSKPTTANSGASTAPLAHPRLIAVRHSSCHIRRALHQSESTNRFPDRSDAKTTKWATTLRPVGSMVMHLARNSTTSLLEKSSGLIHRVFSALSSSEAWPYARQSANIAAESVVSPDKDPLLNTPTNGAGGAVAFACAIVNVTVPESGLGSDHGRRRRPDRRGGCSCQGF